MIYLFIGVDDVICHVLMAIWTKVARIWVEFTICLDGNWIFVSSFEW